jgi:hypothetical protein
MRGVILNMFGSDEHCLRRHWPARAVAANGELVVVDWGVAKAAADLMAPGGPAGPADELLGTLVEQRPVAELA